MTIVKKISLKNLKDWLAKAKVQSDGSLSKEDVSELDALLSAVAAYALWRRPAQCRWR